MAAQNKDSNKVIRERRSIRVESRLTIAQYEQLLNLRKDLTIDIASLIRFSLFKESRKVVISVRELLSVMDHLGTTLGHSGSVIARALRQSYLCKNKDGTSDDHSTKPIDELLEKHIYVQEKLENHMRKLIRLMSD
jgi:hypothetical protein